MLNLFREVEGPRRVSSIEVPVNFNGTIFEHPSQQWEIEKLEQILREEERQQELKEERLREKEREKRDLQRGVEELKERKQPILV